jgi:acyl-coenzyme A thioesterase PaaI-like protein
MADLTDPSPSRAALGAAIRQLAHDMVGHLADDALIDEMTTTLAAFSERMVACEPRSRENSGFHEHWDSDVVEGEEVLSYEYRPFSGQASPWSVEPDIRRRGDGVVATVVFGAAHEGAPERCHGGIVAGLFDDILGSVLSVTGEGAFTGELTVRYNAPVPLHTPLACACWVERREGRKLHMLGELSDGDQIVSTARAIFIQPREAATQSTFDPA